MRKEKSSECSESWREDPDSVYLLMSWKCPESDLGIHTALLVQHHHLPISTILPLGRCQVVDHFNCNWLVHSVGICPVDANLKSFLEKECLNYKVIFETLIFLPQFSGILFYYIIRLLRQPNPFKVFFFPLIMATYISFEFPIFSLICNGNPSYREGGDWNKSKFDYPVNTESS